jgi:hypothetical protein
MVQIVTFIIKINVACTVWVANWNETLILYWLDCEYLMHMSSPYQNYNMTGLDYF